MTPIYSLRRSKVSSILVGQWGELSWVFFFVIYHKVCVFITFTSFFDEVSNFCNSILTNQKRELVFSSCLWNCMIMYELLELMF